MSVENSTDLLSLLMLQNGSGIVNEGFTRADMGREAEAALAEYTKFGVSQDPNYTWNDSFGDSNTAFAEGGVAMTFAYPGDIREIKEENPFLDFGISGVPQINTTSPTNFANYWGLAVASGSPNADAAWDFVIFATTDRISSENYIIETGHAPALRFLIDSYINDATIGVFARQALSARSWAEPDDDRVNEIFDDMIKAVVSDGIDINDAIGEARSALTELIRG